jgi:hypothetical protein
MAGSRRLGLVYRPVVGLPERPMPMPRLPVSPWRQRQQLGSPQVFGYSQAYPEQHYQIRFDRRKKRKRGGKGLVKLPSR